MSRREAIILGVAIGSTIVWAWPLVQDLSRESIRLCSWPDGHLQCVTWPGPIQIMGGR
jgi:hypothetical protein